MKQSPKDISALSFEVERLRFTTDFGLSTEHGRLLQLSLELSSRVPRHPISLNIRAFQVLPETALPQPPSALKEAAALFIKKDLNSATQSATAALEVLEQGNNSLIEQGRAQVVIGDLLLLQGQTVEAERCFIQANAILGDLPPIVNRLGQVKFEQKRFDEAHSLAKTALSTNPLYGSAMMLFWESAIKQGRQLAPLPMPERATIDSSNEMRIDPTLTGKALRAWQAWLMAVPSDTMYAPPKKGQYDALLKEWAARGEQTAERYDDPGLLAKADLDRLERFREAGILDGYLWLLGLNLSSAETWRQWSTKNPEAMNMFWSTAPEV